MSNNRRRNDSRTLDVEKALGFKWPRGMNRSAGVSQYPVMKSLLGALGALAHKYACSLTPQRLQMSAEVKAATNTMFETHGPQLWPEPEQDRPAWLADAEKNKLDGRYPRNLYYSDVKDREM